MYRKYCWIILPFVLIVLLPRVLSNFQDVLRVKRVVDGDTLLMENMPGSSEWTQPKPNI